MESVAEQLRVLVDGAEQVTPRDELEAKLAEVVAGRRPPLRVKFGVDPTAPHLHLGHTVVLRKLADFQRLGHTAVLIVGGFTAQVGDPSGRSAARPRLSPEEVSANAATYLAQAGNVLSSESLEVVDNADWLAPMSMSDVLTLASQITVARMLERSDFSSRYEAGRPIAVTEFLYPLLQGRDSVAVEADVELGGTDQTFNLFVGRDLQADAGQSPQAVMTLPLLEGTDGHEKMSATAGNAIGIEEPAAEMYGKMLSLPDGLMTKYLRLVTDLHPDDVDALANELSSGKTPAVEVKRRLAREVVALFHSSQAATEAESRFDRQFRERLAPEDALSFDPGARDSWFLPSLLTECGLAASGSEARRKVAEGSVRLDGQRLTDPTAELPVESLDGHVLQLGKRRFVRLRRS